MSSGVYRRWEPSLRRRVPNRIRWAPGPQGRGGDAQLPGHSACRQRHLVNHLMKCDLNSRTPLFRPRNWGLTRFETILVSCSQQEESTMADSPDFPVPTPTTGTGRCGRRAEGEELAVFFHPEGRRGAARVIHEPRESGLRGVPGAAGLPRPRWRSAGHYGIWGGLSGDELAALYQQRSCTSHRPIPVADQPPPWRTTCRRPRVRHPGLPLVSWGGAPGARHPGVRRLVQDGPQSLLPGPSVGPEPCSGPSVGPNHRWRSKPHPRRSTGLTGACPPSRRRPDPRCVPGLRSVECDRDGGNAVTVVAVVFSILPASTAVPRWSATSRRSSRRAGRGSL